MHVAEIDIAARVPLLTFKRFYNSIARNETSRVAEPRLATQLYTQHLAEIFR